MTKKNIKAFICGFLACLLIMSSVGVFADSITKQINVIYKNIKVAINGKEIKMDSQPFLLNNTTYVPLRVVSENLGVKVNWNSKTNTVEIVNGSDTKAAQLPNNYQEIEYTDGSKYIGEVKNGMANGFGTLIYSPTDENGRLRYDGQWKDNNREGYGTIVFKDGSMIASLKWEKNDLNDFVISSTAAGYLYSGQVKKGVYHGLGISVEPEKSFAGEWSNGLLHGYNLVVGKDGTKTVARFENNKAAEILNSTLNTTTPKASPVEISDKSTTSELLEYLRQNYSSLQTSKGITKFTFDILENKTTMFPQDYWLQVDYDMAFFSDLKISNQWTDADRAKVKQELRDFTEKMGKDIVSKMPNKKITGGFYKSWYRYPNLRIDLITRQYFTWQNYDEPDYLSSDKYSQVKPSVFRWNEHLDDEL